MKKITSPVTAADQDQHLNISDELLTAIGWLVTYEQESLKKIITNALHNGLQEALTQAPKRNKELSPDAIQATVFELFMLLEALVHESQHETEATTFLQRSLVPAISRIDMKNCDETAVAISAAKATAAAGNGGNSKEVLCRELLRRWKPAKKPTLH